VLILTLREDGIIHAVPKARLEQSLADAQENLAAVRSLTCGKRHPLLLDVRGAGPISREARAHYVGDESAELVHAQALVSASTFDRVAANFYLRLAKARFPIRMFDSEEAAVEWLRGFL